MFVVGAAKYWRANFKGVGDFWVFCGRQLRRKLCKKGRGGLIGSSGRLF